MATPKSYKVPPALVKFHVALTPTQPLPWSKRLHLLNIRNGLTGITNRIRTISAAGIGSPQPSPHPAGTYTTPTHAPAHVPLTQLKIPTPSSDQTPGPGSAMHPLPRGAPTDHDPIPQPSLVSGQTLVQELPQTPLPEQPAAVHSAPAVVSAPVRLPVQLFAHLNDQVSASLTPALRLGQRHQEPAAAGADHDRAHRLTRTRSDSSKRAAEPRLSQ